MNTTEEQELVVVPAIARTLKTLVDGTVRIAIDVEPSYRDTAMHLFGEPGITIAVARLTIEASQRSLQQQNTAPYRHEAKVLRLSSFFRSPAVWCAVGTDAQYLAWLREQKCAYCQLVPTFDKRTEAAHVRRAAEGAGIAIKPEYCAIPLCHDHHALQHAKGESALGSREWFDKKRIDYVIRWAWGALKQQLGYESWTQVPTSILYDWVMSNQVAALLSVEYQRQEDA